MKLSLILEAIDRASRPLDRVGDAAGGLGRSARGAARDVGALDRQSGEATRSTARLGREAEDTADEVRDLGREADRATDDVRDLDRSLDRAARSSARMERAARGIGAGLAAASRRGIGALGAIDRRLTISQGRMEKMAFAAGSLIGTTIRGGVMAGGAIAGAGLSAALYKVVTAGISNEKFRTQLNGLEGSAEAGKRAFDWVGDFAKKTPYEMTDVMEAFIALKAYGIDPTNGTLKSLGDTAAGMGKDLMQAVEMLADAQTGEFERIKEFGVKASVAGDKVTFRWQQNGREMSKTVRQTATDIRQALLGIMDSRFANGMDRLSQTTAGKWSNLMDSMTQTAARVWETSFGPAINKQLDRLLGNIDRMEKDGSLKKWADETSEGLGDLVEAIGDTDWRGIGGGIRDVGSALMQLAAALRELDRWRNAVGDFQRGAERWTGGGLLGSFETGQYAAPRWLRDAPKPAATLPKRIPLAPLKPTTAPRAPIARPNRVSPLLPGQASFKWPASARPLPTQKATPAKAAPAPKGKLEISVKTTPGASAKVTKVAATGMDVQVNTGRAMGAFA